MIRFCDGHANKKQKLKPDFIVPASGQYETIGPHGDETVKEMKGEII